jgi:hypothetical protein
MTQFSALLRRHLILCARAPVKLTALNALWQRATLFGTRKAAKRTALRTLADAVISGAAQASNAFQRHHCGGDNCGNSQRANEDRMYAHFNISKHPL